MTGNSIRESTQTLKLRRGVLGLRDHPADGPVASFARRARVCASPWQLELQLAFGLRAREAMQLRPHIADQGTYLSITHGTKGGRDRVAPIRTPEQRALLDLAKTFCATRSSSTIDPQRKLAEWKNHHYRVVRSCGITRKDGITSHGLRHQYANERDSPVRGGAHVDRDTDRAAREVVAEELGHSREDVTTHYLGR